jgi:hypothetical protein
MIGFKDQDKLVEEITAGVLHPDYPTCWNVVIPPGFGEDVFCRQLVDKLTGHDAFPMVALLSSDSVRNPNEYIDALHRQWARTGLLPSCDAAPDVGTRLNRLLDSLPNGRVAVQVLSRFHKVLDCLDQWILSTLRTAEQACRIRTVTISPVPYDELKERWVRDHILITSDYGDTHTGRETVPLGMEEITQLFNGRDISNHVLECVYKLTGGYPEPFTAVMEDWLRKETRSFGPVDLNLAAAIAERRLVRFVKWLDRPGESRYRDYVVNLYQGYEPEKSYYNLTFHPWRQALIDEDGLRAVCVGRAAVRRAVQEAVEEGRQHELPDLACNRAALMYKRKQYRPALEILRNTRVGTPSPALDFLRAHSKVMVDLYAGNEAVVAVDTHWRELKRSLVEAKRVLATHWSAIRSPERVKCRYDELESMADSISNAEKVSNRVVDVLAGLIPGTNVPVDGKAACLLLLLQYEIGKTIPGNTFACQLILPLPEQIFRIWAFWALGINYYHAPSDLAHIWDTVEAHWPHDSLRRPEEGKEFSSFEAFAYFALALFLTKKSEHPDLIFEGDFDALASCIGTYQSVRMGSAHAMCICDGKVRRKYFQLVDRWLEFLTFACPGGVSRVELLSIVEPLPVIEHDGSATWPGS